MSPNQIKQKAQKYYDAMKPIFVASSLHARKGADVHLKHKTIRDLLAFFSELKERIMPDISMCAHSECPMAQACYRFKAKPSERQCYFEPPEVPCDYFWPMEDDNGRPS